MNKLLNLKNVLISSAIVFALAFSFIAFTDVFDDDIADAEAQAKVFNIDFADNSIVPQEQVDSAYTHCFAVSEKSITNAVSVNDEVCSNLGKIELVLTNSETNTLKSELSISYFQKDWAVTTDSTLVKFNNLTANNTLLIEASLELDAASVINAQSVLVNGTLINHGTIRTTGMLSLGNGSGLNEVLNYGEITATSNFQAEHTSTFHNFTGAIINIEKSHNFSIFNGVDTVIINEGSIYGSLRLGGLRHSQFTNASTIVGDILIRDYNNIYGYYLEGTWTTSKYENTYNIVNNASITGSVINASHDSVTFTNNGWISGGFRDNNAPGEPDDSTKTNDDTSSTGPTASGENTGSTSSNAPSATGTKKPVKPKPLTKVQKINNEITAFKNKLNTANSVNAVSAAAKTVIDNITYLDGNAKGETNDYKNAVATGVKVIDKRNLAGKTKDKYEAALVKAAVKAVKAETVSTTKKVKKHGISKVLKKTKKQLKKDKSKALLKARKAVAKAGYKSTNDKSEKKAIKKAVRKISKKII
jgi:hypothetical protein